MGDHQGKIEEGMLKDEEMSRKLVFIKMALQLLERARLHPDLTWIDAEGETQLAIVMDTAAFTAPVTVIRKKGEVSLGVVEEIGRCEDGE
jgi:hypothetical protein